MEVLKWVLKHVRQQWDHQNDELHRQQLNRVKDLAVDANICKQYNIGTNNMTQSSNTLFQEMLKHTLNLPHNDKWQWLTLVKAVQNQYCRASAQSIKAQ